MAGGIGRFSRKKIDASSESNAAVNEKSPTTTAADASGGGGNGNGSGNSIAKQSTSTPRPSTAASTSGNTNMFVSFGDNDRPTSSATTTFDAFRQDHFQFDNEDTNETMYDGQPDGEFYNPSISIDDAINNNALLSLQTMEEDEDHDAPTHENDFIMDHDSFHSSSPGKPSTITDTISTSNGNNNDDESTTSKHKSTIGNSSFIARLREKSQTNKSTSNPSSNNNNDNQINNDHDTTQQSSSTTIISEKQSDLEQSNLCNDMEMNGYSNISNQIVPFVGEGTTGCNTTSIGEGVGDGTSNVVEKLQHKDGMENDIHHPDVSNHRSTLQSSAKWSTSPNKNVHSMEINPQSYHVLDQTTDEANENQDKEIVCGDNYVPHSKGEEKEQHESLLDLQPSAGTDTTTSGSNTSISNLNSCENLESIMMHHADTNKPDKRIDSTQNAKQDEDSSSVMDNQHSITTSTSNLDCFDNIQFTLLEDSVGTTSSSENRDMNVETEEVEQDRCTLHCTDEHSDEVSGDEEISITPKVQVGRNSPGDDETITSSKSNDMKDYLRLNQSDEQACGDTSSNSITTNYSSLGRVNEDGSKSIQAPKNSVTTPYTATNTPTTSSHGDKPDTNTKLLETDFGKNVEMNLVDTPSVSINKHQNETPSSSSSSLSKSTLPTHKMSFIKKTPMQVMKGLQDGTYQQQRMTGRVSRTNIVTPASSLKVSGSMNHRSPQLNFKGRVDVNQRNDKRPLTSKTPKQVMLHQDGSSTKGHTTVQASRTNVVTPASSLKMSGGMNHRIPELRPHTGTTQQSPRVPSSRDNTTLINVKRKMNLNTPNHTKKLHSMERTSNQNTQQQHTTQPSSMNRSIYHSVNGTTKVSHGLGLTGTEMNRDLTNSTRCASPPNKVLRLEDKSNFGSFAPTPKKNHITDGFVGQQDSSQTTQVAAVTPMNHTTSQKELNQSDKSFDDVLFKFRSDLVEACDMREGGDAELLDIRVKLSIAENVSLRLHGDLDDILDEADIALTETDIEL